MTPNTTPDHSESDPGTTEWLNTADAARRLGCRPPTLYRFIDHGELPAYRFGRVIRLKTADVNAYVESRQIKPGTLAHLYPPDPQS